ncbi:hypothetical protein V6Z11_A08G206300 [Gossypium hirsutum]
MYLSFCLLELHLFLSPIPSLHFYPGTKCVAKTQCLKKCCFYQPAFGLFQDRFCPSQSKTLNATAGLLSNIILGP